MKTAGKTPGGHDSEPGYYILDAPIKKGGRPMPASETIVAVAFGANRDNPVATIEQAADNLRRLALPDLRLAPFYETRPVDCIPGTPPFINTVGIGTTSLSPGKLLDTCKAIEVQLGRPPRHDSGAARQIDLDIVLWDDREVRIPGLVIPHPRFTERLFVLVPLADLAPDWSIPGLGQTVGERAAALRERADPGWGRRLEPA